jgi:hypothetical protein
VEDAPVLCPACSTPWDFKQTPCRTCKKKVDWVKYQEEAHIKARDLKNMLKRKKKLAAIRKKQKDKEEQRKLDVALKIAQQKADALKWQKEKLLRQRQAKQALRDGNNAGSNIDNGSEAAAKAVGGFLLGNEKKKKNTPMKNKKQDKQPTILVELKNKQQHLQRTKELKTDSDDSEEEEEDEEEDEEEAARMQYVEAQPAGYSFPLLSIYAERDHGMRLERMRNPNIMSSEENLLRTLDQLTRNEVHSNGRRNRSNKVAKKRESRQKKFEKRLFMYDMDHIKRKPKYPDAVGNKEFVFEQKKKPVPKNWVNIHGVTKVKDVQKAEHFLEQLHAEQVAETLRAQEIAKVQANGDHRRQLKLYTLMKGAESQDKMIDLMDDAGMLSMPQLIKHVQKSVRLDHVIAEKMREQNV